MPERKKISDTCLLNRLVDGEMKAYEEIFVRYYPTLCTYAGAIFRPGCGL